MSTDNNASLVEERYFGDISSMKRICTDSTTLAPPSPSYSERSSNSCLSNHSSEVSNIVKSPSTNDIIFKKRSTFSSSRISPKGELNVPSSTYSSSYGTVLNSLLFSRKQVEDSSIIFRVILPLWTLAYRAFCVTNFNTLENIESSAVSAKTLLVEVFSPDVVGVVEPWIATYMNPFWVCVSLAIELWSGLVFFGFFTHWQDVGHFISVWIFLIYTQVCGLRFFLYDNPGLFCPIFLACACLPLLPQMVQIHSEKMPSTEVRVPPFVPKKEDIVDTKYNKGLFAVPPYLGYFLMRIVSSNRLRWCVTLFLYVFPTLGGFLGLYRMYCAAHAGEMAPPQWQNSVGLVQLAMLVSFCVWASDTTAYVIAVLALRRLGRAQKVSSGAYKTGPYDPPRLDNDQVETLIAKARYLKANSSSNDNVKKSILTSLNSCTVDSISTPMAFEYVVADDNNFEGQDVIDEIFRPLTVVLPAYMPNEEAIIMDVLQYYQSEEKKYPPGFKVLLVWNSPKLGDYHKDIEEKLAALEAKWSGFKSIRVMESTCKADNLNVAIRMLDTDFALFNDSDTIVSAETMCRASIHIFGPEQYDVAQGRNIYCEPDYLGHPEDPESTSRITAMLAFRDSFAQTNTFMGLLFDRSNFNGRGGFWRTSAIKQVEFDPRTLAEDHDASCRGFMYFGHRGVLDNNMLCLEREPAEWDAVNKQRRRWMHCALQIMDRTIMWNWASKYTSSGGLLEQWVYWYTYTESRLPTEAPIYYLFFFEILGSCYRDYNTSTSEYSTSTSSSETTALIYIAVCGIISCLLRMTYICQHVSQCRYNPGWMKCCIPLHICMMLLQGCWHKLLAYHDYYWGTGKWICTARAVTSVVGNSKEDVVSSASNLKAPLLQ